MKRTHVLTVVLSAVLMTPSLIFAQGGAVPSGRTVNTISNMINLASSIMNSLIGLAITAGILAFIWGLVRYIWGGGEDKAAGLQTMLWGTLAIFFMVSIWGMVRILQNTLGVDSRALNAPSGPNTRGGSTVGGFNQGGSVREYQQEQGRQDLRDGSWGTYE